MYRLLFLFIVFIILKNELSLVAIIESIIFTTITFIIHKTCISKLGVHSNNKISTLNLIKFTITIIKDILISSWNISKLILCKQTLSSIEPTIQKIKIYSLLQTNTVILATSITLTPGTMTFAIEKDCLYIHALNKNYITEIQNSKLLHYIENI